MATIYNFKWGLGFFINLTFTRIISKWQNVTLFQKRVNIPTQTSSQILKPLFYDFWEAFVIGGSGAMTAHLPQGFMSIVTNGLDQLVKIAFARNRWKLVTRTFVVDNIHPLDTGSKPLGAPPTQGRGDRVCHLDPRFWEELLWPN